MSAIAGAAEKGPRSRLRYRPLSENDDRDSLVETQEQDNQKDTDRDVGSTSLSSHFPAVDQPNHWLSVFPEARISGSRVVPPQSAEALLERAE